MTEILTTLTSQGSLSREAARNALLALASGEFNPAQMSAFITAYLMRPITITELEGFRDAMLELCVPLPVEDEVMDVCGTGGDGKNTFNISTAAAFVVAAGGQKVAKHGNYGVSSVSGSSNVLETLGYAFSTDVDFINRCLEEANICFLHAPLFHPAMKRVAPIRKELGLRTFFNMLGPMVNPARPAKQLVGVFSLELARQYGYVYQRAGTDFTIIHDLNGFDEVSLTAPVKVFATQGERILEPGDFGLTMLRPVELLGGQSVGEATRIFLEIIQGRGTSAQMNAVSANAALALLTAGMVKSLEQGVLLAMEMLKSGKAFRALERIIQLSSAYV